MTGEDAQIESEERETCGEEDGHEAIDHCVCELEKRLHRRIERLVFYWINGFIASQGEIEVDCS